MVNLESSYSQPKISDAIDAIRNLSAFLVTIDFYENEQFRKTILKIEEKLENDFLESKKMPCNLSHYGFEKKIINFIVLIFF